MPVMHVDFEVSCDKCGAGLCSQSRAKDTHIYVSPCESCLIESYDNGHESGFDEGYSAAGGEGEGDNK